MIHVHQTQSRYGSSTSVWKYTTEPFAAFRCQLSFGRNKHDQQFLPCSGVEPDTVTGLLPKNNFRVIRTREKGTLLLVTGEDTTNRALLFCSENGGFRGGVEGISAGSEAEILKCAAAGNACESTRAVIAILAVRQSIAFRIFGRREDRVHQLLWTGSEIQDKFFSWSEWNQREQLTHTEGSEVI